MTVQLPKTVEEVVSLIEAQKEGFEFLPTGFSKLDSHLDGGFLRKELIVLGGRTGIGKTYLAGQIMLNIAKQGFKSAYFSLEVSAEMVVSRMIGSIANIKPTLVRTGFLTPEDYAKKTQAIARLSAYSQNLHFYDETYELEAISNQIRENKYEFVVIDFLQNIIGRGEEEYARLSHAALQLQKLAKETNSTILVLSQLSNLATREGEEAKVLEYKGSGSIATVCDLGFVIDRVEVSEDFKISRLNMNLRKNRRGTSGHSFPLAFKIPGGWITEE